MKKITLKNQKRETILNYVTFIMSRFSFVLVFCFGILFGSSVLEAATFDVSGTLYTDAGVTAAASGKTIKMAVGTSSVGVFSTTTEAGGVWNFYGIDDTGLVSTTSFTVWLDGDASDASLVLGGYSGSNISNLFLYYDYVIANTASSTVTLEMDGFYTYDNEDDSDIPFTASTTIGVTDVSLDYTFYVASSTSLKLNSPLAVDDFETATTAAVFASSTLTVAGDFVQLGTLTSNDTVDDWTARSAAGNNDPWESIAYGNGTFVAVAANFFGDHVITSSDGITWTARSAAGNNDYWRAVTYGNGLFVAVGSSGNDRVMTSPDGITWTARSAAGNNDAWQSVTYGNGLFVAVGGGSEQVMTSPDGINWTVRSAAGDNDAWQSVIYGNGLFVAVGSFGDRVMTSPDGTTWTARSAAGDNDSWYGVTYGNGLFVVVGSSGDRVMTSPDGINWTVRSAAGDNDAWQSVTYGNGLFVAVGGGSEQVMTSPDGTTWTARSAAGDNDSWYGVTYGDSLFVAVGIYGDIVMTSEGVFPIHFSGANGSAPQNISGNLTGSSALPDLVFSGTSTKTLLNDIETGYFTIGATAATVTLPAVVTINGSYANSGGSVDAGEGTITLAGTSKNISGSLTGEKSLHKLLVTGSYTAVNNASTSHLTIEEAATFTAPNLLTIDGEINNDGTFTHNSGTVYLSGYGNFSVANGTHFHSQSITGYESGPTAIIFSTDGLKMFITGYSGDDVNEFTLSTAFDVSTASFVDAFSVASQEDNPQALAFSTDGMKMFVAGSSGDDVNEFTLSTAFDVSTASFVDAFSVATQETSPLGLGFSTNGLKMFVTGSYSDAINEYTLSTAFDVSTASFVDAFSLSAQNNTSPADLAFSSDGKRMFVLDPINKRVDQYNLGTAFDVSTASYVVSMSTSAQENSSSGITFSADGSKFYLTGNDGDSIYSFTLDATHYGQLTGASSLNNLVVSDNKQNLINNASTSDLTIASGATLIAPSGLLGVRGNYTNNGSFEANGGSLYLEGSSKTLSGSMVGVNKFDNLVVVGDHSFSANASTTDITILGSGELTAPSILSIDGDYSNQGVFTHNSGKVLADATAFDLESMSFLHATSVAAQEYGPRSAEFSSDGLKMFVIGIFGDDVNEYTLSTAFDVSTASFVDSFSIAAQEINPMSLAFSNDGLKMFVLGFSGVDVNEYTLSTAFDVSTASFVDSFSVSAQETNPRGLAFSNDGTEMFVAGSSGDDVNEYTLSTAFDVSTASFVDSFSVASQEASLQGLSFSSDGLVMLVTGSVGKDVNEYTLSTAFDVSTASFVEAFPIGQFDSKTNDAFFSPDGTKLYLVGEDNDAVYQFELNQPQVFSGDMTGASGFNDVLINSTLSTTFISDVDARDMLVNVGTSLIIPTSTLSVTGDYVNNGSLTSSGSISLDGAGKVVSGDLVGVNALPNVIVTGSYTASNNASTSDLSITGSGDFTAPSLLTIAGDFSQNGGFDNNSGTIYFTGPDPEVMGDLVGVNALNKVIVAPSSQGVEWVTRSAAGDDDSWRSVVYGNGIFVAVAWTGDRVMTSPDGITWTVHSASGDDDNWKSIAYGNGTFVAVGAGGTRVMTSTDGITWTNRSAAGDDDTWNAVAYGDGLFVAVGYNGDRVMTSPDGITWTARSAAGDNDTWNAVAYGDGLFVAVGQLGDRVMTSPNGIDWTVRAAGGGGEYWRAVTYGNGRFVVLGGSGGSRIMSSQDGITWEIGSAVGNNDEWNAITYGNGTFVGVSYSGDRVMTSSDGLTWTARSAAGDDDTWYSVAYGNGTFVAVGAGGTRVMASDGKLSLTSAAAVDVTVLPAKTLISTTTLTITGNYTNNGTLVASTSEIIFAGTTQQTATGTLSASSSLYDLTITNTSGSGSTTQSVIFGAPITTTGTFTMVASTSAQFLAGATSTFENVDWLGGDAESPVWLRSSGDTTDWYLDIPGSRLNVQYMDVKSANAGANSSGVVYAFDSVDAGNNTNWDFDPQIGSSTISNHDSDQVDNAFSSQSAVAGSLFAFKLTPETGDATVSNLVLSLVGVKKITTGNFSNLKLYRDHNSDGVYDAGDEQVGGAGVMQIDGQYGTITFSADFAATTSQNYLVVGDWSVGYGAAVTLRLPTSGVTTVDAVTYQQIFGAVDPVLHDKNEKSTKGVAVEIGGGAPTGREVLSGGTNDGGEQIGDDPNFKWPTGHSGIWSGMAYAYDQVDGTYAAAFESFMTASYLNHYLIIPGSNSIQGIEVKLEVSGTTAAGDIDVDLSWDGGTTWTTIKTTPTLTTTDTVVSLGGPSDTWGRAWTASEFSNTNFVVRLDANPSSNNVQVDAIQVRVYHQAGGGGAGGGGGGGGGAI